MKRRTSAPTNGEDKMETHIEIMRCAQRGQQRDLDKIDAVAAKFASYGLKQRTV